MDTGILETIANISAILTAAVASLAYTRFLWGQRRRRRALEAHLREEAINDNDEGKRSVLHLMAHLAMTEAEVLQAGYQSKTVRAVPGRDDQGRAARIYFQYVQSDRPAPKTL